ncbi:MAG TPA: methyltransferase domain-containing protein [Lapillicoccus sp.]|nr:methyltransferase domain-containing protein [Lapillicoccus sp.]
MGWRHATPAGKTERDAVEAAIAATPRANHLPRGQQQYADLDRALPIGYGQTNSQPTTVRAMLRALRVRPGMRVLDVGSGSGWTTVLLARLVGETGRVVGVERIAELVDDGGRAVAAAGLPWATVRRAGPVLGLPEEAPFDRILVSAQAHEVPRELVDQLDGSGLMVVPVEGQLLRVDALGRQEDLGCYVFVPLVTGNETPWD